MQLGHIELFATDVQATATFYRRFFGCETVVEQGGGRLVWLKTGQIELLIRPEQRPGASKKYGQGGPALVFYTSDLSTDLARLRADGLEPVACDCEETCPLFRDPDGTWIQLVEPS